MEITSTAFKTGQSMPIQYTCDGDNISPPLIFTGIPSEAKSLALVVEDPDAPNPPFIHWLVWNMEPTTTGTAEGKDFTSGVSGLNSGGKSGFTGPCPPGENHRYFFKLYALDDELTLEPETTHEQFLAAADTHIMAVAELMATYERQPQ